MKEILDNKIEQTERPDQIDRREFIIQVGEIGLTTLATYFSLLLKDAYAERTPEFLINFQKAYEDHIYRKEGNYLILRNGTRIQINDNIKKTPEQKLENADLEDQMLLPYYGGDYVQKNWQSLTPDYDPGRIRCQKFFSSIYGSSPSEVSSKLVTLTWPFKTAENKHLKITTVNNVDKQLKEVLSELQQLIAQKPHFRKYLENIAGSFNYRKIKNSNQLSPHSWGIAIDINATPYGDYWLWNSDKNSQYENQIPIEIVKIFEKYGLIWGENWMHYDTMHFEFRPELLPNYKKIK